MKYGVTYHHADADVFVVLSSDVVRLLVLLLGFLSNFSDCCGDVLVQLSMVILLIHAVCIFFDFACHLPGVL